MMPPPRYTGVLVNLSFMSYSEAVTYIPSLPIAIRHWDLVITRQSGEAYTCNKGNDIRKDKGFAEILNDVKVKNISGPTIGQLNINSIRNKFHFLESVASKHLEILLISETKIDEKFPTPQVLLDGSLSLTD